jgi:hypothetical protein
MLPVRWNAEYDDDVAKVGAGRMRNIDDPRGEDSMCLSNGSITRNIRPSMQRRESPSFISSSW